MLLVSRKAEKFTGERWEPISFETLKKGDIFRLFEEDGTAVDGGRASVALGDAYPCGSTWGVEVSSFVSAEVRETLLRFQDDPFKRGAALVLNKDVNLVTQEERRRFKQAVFCWFYWKAPDIIRSQIDEGAGVEAQMLRDERAERMTQGEPF